MTSQKLPGSARSLPWVFIAGRLFMLMALPLDGLRGYGDSLHFYRLAAMGRPFLDLWVEFPPVFPFLSRLLYVAAREQEHVYLYLLVGVLSLVQAGSLAVFARLAHRSLGQPAGMRRSWVYLVALSTVAYGWWYFDPLAVLAILLGLWWATEGKGLGAGISLGVGVLVKWFPILALPAIWGGWPRRRSLLLTGAVVSLTLGVYAALFSASPAFTSASVRSQAQKGSWETVWALWDGNLNTGNFGPEVERLDPAMAYHPRGEPARVSPWLTLIPFAVLGAWLYRQADLEKLPARLAFFGVTWGLFLLWSPGWSPQWVLYLLPIVLLVLPEREALLTLAVLVLVNLLEWPVLLSRGYFWGLWLTVPIRTALLALLVIRFWGQVPKGRRGRVDLAGRRP